MDGVQRRLLQLEIYAAGPRSLDFIAKILGRWHVFSA